MTVTLLRSDTYEWPFAVPEHQRTHGGVLLIQQGRGALAIGGREYPVAPGDVAIYLPFETHGYRPHEGSSIHALMVNYEFRPRTRDTENEFAPLGRRRVFRGIDEAKELFSAIDEATRRATEHDLLCAESILVGLFHRLLGQCSRQPAQSRQNPVDAAMEQLYGTYTARLNDVASDLGVSSEAIRKQFQKHFGDSPMRYFAGYHVQRLAAVLESSDAPLRVLAEEFGFYDEFHLSRVFKRYTGMSPAAFRRARRNQNESSPPETGEPADYEEPDGSGESNG